MTVVVAARVGFHIIPRWNAHYDISGNGIPDDLVDGLNTLDVSTAQCLYLENNDLAS